MKRNNMYLQRNSEKDSVKNSFIPLSRRDALQEYLYRFRVEENALM